MYIDQLTIGSHDSSSTLYQFHQVNLAFESFKTSVFMCLIEPSTMKELTATFLQVLHYN